MADTTYFDLPTNPEQFGVALTPASLRKIDFSGLDFDTSRKAIYEYIATYFPDQFNDFVASNGIVMITEIVSSIVAKLSLRADLLANESTLPTARTEQAVVNHLALINQKIRNATPAITDVEVSIDNPSFTDIQIPGGLVLSVNGPNNTLLNYEVFKSPYDFTGDIVIPAGKRGVIAYGIEGITGVSDSVISAGGPNQVMNIADTNILDSPITIKVVYGNVSSFYTVIFDPIERYGPNDPVAEVTITSTGITIQFGDDITGKSPKIGSVITVTYRKGGGLRGRIGAFVLDTMKQMRANPPASAPVSVRFRNITAAVGGTDRESITDAKRRAPKDYALQRSIVTASDYAQAAKSFAHPAFGSVAKAVAGARIGLRASIVDLYILALGANGLSNPSAGLKKGLETYISSLNVMTDTVVIHDGRMKKVSLKANVILNSGAEASVVKEKTEAMITSYFDIANWEMGQAFYISSLVEAIQSVDGVLYVDVFSPVNNILSDPVIASDSSPTAVNRIGANEIIVLDSRETYYYYEKS